MKVVRPGRAQRGWSVEVECTGHGNHGGGCGAQLLVEQADVYQTHRFDYGGGHDVFNTFRCAACGVQTDLPDGMVLPFTPPKDEPKPAAAPPGGEGETPVSIGSLFSGIGGLEMGLEACGMGPVVWQCDSDPYARAVLAEHWPGVRRYNDVKEIDGNAARVDLVCGGFPCQPHSLAGKRRGMSDARWLWPEFARIIADVRPAAVFIENVPGLRTSGLSTVLADLAGLGFDAEWGCFSAAEVGAPHRRIRLFVLAHAQRQPSGDEPGWIGGACGAGAAEPANDGASRPAHANGQGELQQGGSVGGEWGRATHGGKPLADADGAGRGWPRDSVAGVRDQADRNPPQPEHGGRDSALGQSAWWAAEPDVGRVADGVPARAHRLRLLGNAVVPQQAAYAFQVLAARASNPKDPTP